MGPRTKPSSSWYSSLRRSSSAPATPRPEPATVAAAAEPPVAAVGCMSMVHYLIFAPGAGCVGRPPTSSSNGAIVSPHGDRHGLGGGDRHDSGGGKSGFEAPRNSLDLDADNPNDIQIGVQIEPVFDALAGRTSSSSMRRTTKPTAPSSEAETPRTPSLVARLMGIDGLPDHQSPARPQTAGGAAGKEHAREILRQAKEAVASRKSSSGKNSASASPAPEKRRQSWFDNKENVMMTSPAAAAMEDDVKLRAAVVQVQQTAKPTAVAAAKLPSVEHHSPRVALAPRQQRSSASPPPPHRAKPSRPPPPPPPLDPPPVTRARKPDGCERFATRIKKPAASPASAPPPTSSLPSSSPTTGCGSASAAARVGVCISTAPPPPAALDEDDPEYSYLRTVLERGGFMRASPPRPRRPGPWGHHSSAPVDPIVFHLLELELPADESRLGPLRHRWNRKLLFHLAQELLADLLPATTGVPLLGKVWKSVRSFPAADCRVVGDIDALVAADLARATVRRHPAAAEEAGDVAEEVADRVLDALVAECVAESLSLSSSSSSSRAAAAAAR